MESASPEQYQQVAAAWPPQMREACRRDLDEAAAAVQGRERERVEFLKQGLRYLELTLAAIEKTVGASEGALEAWEERNRHVEFLKQDFAIAYFWIRYNDRRGFVPLDHLRAERIKRTLFVPNPLPALAPVTHGRFEPEYGVVAERVTYGTQHGLRVPAILYLPKARTGKIPALIVVNGHGGDKYSWYAAYAGILYARAGAAVLTYDPVGEGERNVQRRSGTRAHDRLDRDPILARHLAGLMQTDVSQAVSYLAQRPEVDPSRIAAMGYSMGSFVLALACGVETRLRACVLAGGGNLDGPGQGWDTSKPMCQGLPYQSLSFLGDRPAVIYALHARRGPTLIINGLNDGILLPQHQEPRAFFDDLKRRVSLPGMRKAVFDTEYDPTGGHRPYFLTRAAALWLERELDFSNWSADDIRRMPETHILDWATASGVDMDPRYATEISEGGTRALGAGVPGFTREQLSVFAAEEWELQKDCMILEAWLKRTR